MSRIMLVFLVLVGVFNSQVFIVAAATEDYMLPKTIIPLSYDITLQFGANLFQTNEYTGQSAISIKVLSEVSEIKFHAKGLHIREVTLRKGDTIIIPIATEPPFNIDPISDILTIATVDPLVPDEYAIDINFAGFLNTEDLHGFYKISYFNENNELEYLAATQFEPTHARETFPCFDEPEFKAVFIFRLWYPATHNALTNSPLSGPPISLGLQELASFEPTPLMSTYLNAIIISKFDCDKGDDFQDNVPYQICSRPEMSQARGTALTLGPQIIKVLEDYTGISYKQLGIIKMDQVAIPDFSANAMENWGLVTYREAALLWDQNESSSSDLQRVATIISHEFAHMWFGNFVTMKWWSHLFLNEGFARYFQYFATSKIFPNWKLDKQFVVEQLQKAFLADTSITSKALSSEPQTPTEISDKFNSISYNKGATLLRMVINIMGSEKFQEGIKNYLQAYPTGTAIATDLWNSLIHEESFGFSITEIMEGWTNLAGYPVLFVQIEGKNVVVSQKRFLFSGESDSKWYVPITYTTASDVEKFVTTKPQAWLTPTDETLLLENVIKDELNWIILNNQQTGYYRVNYNALGWDRIAVALRRNNFHGIQSLNRAQIVDDLFNFARAGEIKYSRAIYIINFLKNDYDYFPWFSAFSGFQYILSQIANPEVRVQLSNYILNLMEVLYNSVPITRELDNDHIYTLKQVMTLDWACKLGKVDCIEQTKELFSKYKDEINPIQPSKNLRSVVYCSALRNSDNAAEDWKFLWQKYLTSTQIPTEQVKILVALGCVRDETILTDYLNMAINKDSKIRLQDSRSVFASVYNSNTEGARIVAKFLKNNYNAIYNYYGNSRTMISLISDVAALLTTAEEIEELQILIDSGVLEDDVKIAVEGVLEAARKNLIWIEVLEKQLTDAFKDDVNGLASTYQISTALVFFFSLVYVCCYFP